MPTVFVEGDLFADLELPAIAHGCNCAGAMGKGIALTFRERFPEMYREYKARCADGRFTLGDVFVWSKEKPVVFNLGTQKTPRPTAEMGAVEKSLRAMIQEATVMKIERIGLPRIGAGLGGLEWPPVRQLLLDLGAETSITLKVFETFVAAKR